MEIRRAGPEDAAAIAEVHVRTWQDAYEHVFGAKRLAAITPEGRLARWQEILASGEGLTLVAENDDLAVGFVSVGPSRDEGAQGELYGIYVLPQAWGAGAGPALMSAGLAALRAEGHADAILWVLADNPRARRFYEREGWHDDGGRKRDEFLGLEVDEVRYRIEL